jgi:gliding motility-associated-like protein
MKTRRFKIIIALFSLWSCSAFSQINCTVPLPPVLTSVSVQPETGNTEFTWTLSPSADIAAYILYSFKNGDGMPIDTLWNPSATNYTFVSTATKYFSVSYVVAAYRLPGIPGMPGCPSPLSNVLNTIFCSSKIDTCKKEITINWNDYPDYPKHVLEYKIYVMVNGSQASEIYNVDNMTNTFTFSDFTTDSQYCFVVKAVLEGGSESSSNISCLSTKMQKAPLWINADYATVNADNKILISFTIDPLSEITHFRLESKNGPSGTFKEIAQLVSVNGSVLFNDNQADANIINYYRLTAINNCNIPVKVSNLSSNLVLSLARNGNDLNLSWNSYKEWAGKVSSYRLFINTGKGFEEKVMLQPNDTVFTLGYKEIMYEVTGNEVCFYINASETFNPYGVNSQSISSIICTVPSEIITVPNVFTPNNDLVNDLFRPVLSFTPLDYHLVISDRKGNILFETRDYSFPWDGSQNGNPQPQGVCLWFLKVTTPSGKSIAKTGTLTIISR